MPVATSLSAQRLQTACEKSYFAQPYCIEATGFYFSDLADYEEKAEFCKDSWSNPVEEFEIQYIDGDDGALFNACGINQVNLGTWFNDVEVLDDNEKAALFYLVSMTGYSVADALDKTDDVILYTGHLEDAAEELLMNAMRKASRKICATTSTTKPLLTIASKAAICASSSMKARHTPVPMRTASKMG